MRTFPKRLRRDSVSVATLTGTGARGPVYAAVRTVACRVQTTRELVRNADGEEVISDLTVYIHPDDGERFVPGTRVTFGGRTSTVLSVSPSGPPGQTFMVKVDCT